MMYNLLPFFKRIDCEMFSVIQFLKSAVLARWLARLLFDWLMHMNDASDVSKISYPQEIRADL